MLFRIPVKLLMRALAILVFLAGAGAPAEAGSLQQLTLREMAEKSTSIVRARVRGSSAQLRGSDVYTVYQFETMEALKRQSGTAPSQVAVPGGAAGGLRQVVDGAPTLRPGHEYVLFLWTSRSGLTQLMGMSQGLFSIEHTASGALLTRQAAAGEPMFDSTGRAVAGDALSMPWSELKAKVAQMAGRK